MLNYAFMRNALLAGFIIAIMTPLIGSIMVNRGTSMIGDSLSHVSLAGVGVGLIFGFNPVIGSIVICVIAALFIDAIRKNKPQYGDMGIAVITSAGLGIASVLSDIAPGGNTFESYLFGSISSVTKADVIFSLIVLLFVLYLSVKYYNALLDISVNSNLARIAGVNVNLVDMLFTIITAVAIAISSKVIGALLVTSLIVLPVATSLLISKSYKTTIIYSVILGIIYTMLGIIISYYYDIRPGGTIVILALIGMLIMSLYRKIKK